ncbi:23S rRNA (pseudouridine(1915)-N(3))-methyltransferase RlmH, partial [Escherichia coli]
YSKRLSRFTKLELLELADEKTPDKASQAENEQILAKEAERILSKINERDFVIALAIEGNQFPSEEFSKKLEDITVKGFSEISFVIGGSLGLADSV